MSNLNYFNKKTILITGGTGSIGSHLVRKLVQTDCHAIRVLTNNEHELYNLQNKYNDNSKIRYLLGDIRDKERLVVATDGVDIIFHAAALKHVPICEHNPLDAIRTNVIGTQNIIEAAIETGVEKFAFISTDKAASPLTTLGATKLLAERLTIASMSYRAKTPILYSVRFGNVLWSRGSVAELFLNQIKQDKPLTVTHPKMTRFTMTADDAIDLILSTSEIAKGGEIFVLKMKVMKIVDLAKAMIELYGSSQHKIIETGIRQSEKMFEELITHEEANRAREINNMYVIPQYDMENYNKYPKMDLAYNSSSVNPMSVKEIKEMLQQSKLD